MESIYREMFGSSELLSEQICGHLLDLAGQEGPVLVFIDTNRRITASHPGRVGFLLAENSRLVETVCSSLDDGEDPLVIQVKGGCAAACQLATERVHCGYLFVYLEGYTPETVSANIGLVEMILAQAQLICAMVEKNNQLHQFKLVHLSRTSEILAR